ncbi:mannose-1-phosphate guanylyltransferase/mannose-6-phosphate isomerase [Sphingomonas mesophila]|uniref:mannose-1-phosphate guanylyltransferase/mannose-6-phosphate isomerase n=1 Tax=Sphingomonas mesophila TaxID=2303576 RepID=UPI000E57C22E|nr:mannose-1-phosphate guanylyltransferase/mannose-6-phosphate isomerase [Sphingomonas mesophila]
MPSDLIVRPVILSGGAGTRLWPVSRLAFPKQLLPIAADRTMLQVTAGRVTGPAFAAPIVVGDEEHRFFIKDQFERDGLTLEAILLEPSGRNTAPAIALAASFARDQLGDEILLVLPSDHVIRDEAAFRAAVAAATPTAAAGGLVTFGIVPDSPHSGYGYIEIGAETEAGTGVHRVARFVEKPSVELAGDYLADGRFLWNSGMFLFRASAMLNDLAAHAPDVAAAVRSASREIARDGVFARPAAQEFAAAPSISIDFAVMEKTANAYVVPVDIGWSDVGSWSSLWDISAKDDAGNVIQGSAIALDSRDCLLRSDHDRLVVALGLEGIGVVVTRDAVLVTDLERSQDVKLAVDILRERGDEAAVSASEVFRPWGSYQTTDRGDRFQTKRIVVKPGARLSLQKHHHRSEHWVVVTGTAEVTIGDDVRLLQENESTYIPAGTAHRLANPGKVPLHLIEVQCGPYLGEDDIVRIEDEYGRNE